MVQDYKSAIDVSIIIPVYNVEKYLDECVCSAMKQSHKNIEIILVDDGSTDRSGLMCDAYTKIDTRIKVIHKINGGLGSARNAGLEAASGEYILLLDSDDYLDLDTVDILFNCALQNRLDMLLFTAESFVDGKVQDEVVIGDYQTYKTRLDEVMSGEECLEHLFQSREYIVSNCMRMYHRSIMHFRYSEDIIHEDEDIGIYTFLLSNRVMKKAAPLYKRRYRAGSIMTNSNPVAEASGYMYAAMKMLEYRDRVSSEQIRGLLLDLFEKKFNTVCDKYLLSNPIERRKIGNLIRMNSKKIILKHWHIRKKTLLKMIFPWLIEAGEFRKRHLGNS